MMRISSNRAGLWWDQDMLLLAEKYSYGKTYSLCLNLLKCKTNLACVLHCTLHAECSCSHLGWLGN